MPKENPSFVPITENATLTPGQEETLLAVFALDRYIALDNKNTRIDLPSLPDVEVTGGADGFKLIVKAPTRSLFAKIYVKPEHAVFVAHATRSLTKCLQEYSPHILQNCDSQSVVGTMGRALIMRFRNDIIGENNKIHNLYDRTQLKKELLQPFPPELRTVFSNVMAPPGVLDLPDGIILLSDLILDGYWELEHLVPIYTNTFR